MRNASGYFITNLIEGKEKKHINTMGIPWHDNGYNMLFPKETLYIDENNENDLIHEIICGNDVECVEVLHIKTNMKDFSWLNKMHGLKNLYIYEGNSLDNINFLDNMKELRDLYIADATLKDLSPLINLMNRQQELLDLADGMDKISVNKLDNIALYNCKIGNLEKFNHLNKIYRLSNLLLDSNGIEDINGINMLKGYYTSLRRNNIKDVSLLKDYSCYLLNLRHNLIEDINCWQGGEIVGDSLNNGEQSLGRLFLKYNLIEDFSVLKGLCLVMTDLSNEQYKRY